MNPGFNPVDWFFGAEPSLKVSVVALGWSLVTSAIALGGLITAIRSLNATRRQEARRQPKVVIAYLESSSITTDLGTEYTFRIRAKNPTEASNAITSGELEIRYMVDATLVSLRVPSLDAEGALSLPATIAAGTSLEGDVRFFAAAGLLEGRKPRDFVAIFIDTFENKSEIPVEIIYARTPAS
ncbi:hypothetical protein [Frigoribacterium sp. Leaf44]|uniref:hypothetical protein n=1 Tax=Frigoribacterium sp. Leaf44 TaxID=1736220 RepID=UPI000A50AEF4|nr:hypothetical protein [Frigoribacterium sp. Leaf44]